MSRAIEVIGMLIFVVMGSALDSESMIPMFGTIAGLVVIVFGKWLEERYA